MCQGQGMSVQYRFHLQEEYDSASWQKAKGMARSLANKVFQSEAAY